MRTLSFVFYPYRETLEADRALIEERYEDKIDNIQKHLKKFYSQELKVRASSLYCFQPVSVPMLWFQHTLSVKSTLEFNKIPKFSTCPHCSYICNAVAAVSEDSRMQPLWIKSFLSGARSGDWSFVCRPWYKKGNRLCACARATGRLWRASTISPHHE